MVCSDMHHLLQDWSTKHIRFLISNVITTTQQRAIWVRAYMPT